jgi:hypothetical protein
LHGALSQVEEYKSQIEALCQKHEEELKIVEEYKAQTEEMVVKLNEATQRHEEELESMKIEITEQCNAHYLPFLQEKQTELDKWDAVFQIVSQKAQHDEGEEKVMAQQALHMLSACVAEAEASACPADEDDGDIEHEHTSTR